MSNRYRLAIFSDPHYASNAEQQRRHYQMQGIDNPLARLAIKSYRRWIWLRDPFAHNHLLDQFLSQTDSPDYVIANGDYSCDSAFVGVSDDAAFQSASECLQKVRTRFPATFLANFGDHELGKKSLGGGQGGMRLASWHRAQNGLGLRPHWRVEAGNYVFISVVSSLVGFPVFEPDCLPEEREEWQQLRTAHLSDVRRTFASLKPNQRVLLLCHDPTALPFLWRESDVQSKLNQIEQTIIGHLHSNLVLWKSRLLAGMPVIRFLGNTPRRLSSALNQARYWKPFRVRLCPALAGIQIEQGGGFYTVDLDANANEPARFQLHRLKR